jgi:hypothetical protein
LILSRSIQNDIVLRFFKKILKQSHFDFFFKSHFGFVWVIGWSFWSTEFNLINYHSGLTLKPNSRQFITMQSLIILVKREKFYFILRVITKNQVYFKSNCYKKFYSLFLGLFGKKYFYSKQNCQNKFKGVFDKQLYWQKVPQQKMQPTKQRFNTWSKTKSIGLKHWFNPQPNRKSWFDLKLKQIKQIKNRWSKLKRKTQKHIFLK